VLRNQSLVFWSAFAASMALLGVNYFRWKLVGLLPFVEPQVEALVGWAFLGATLISLLHLFLGFKRHRLYAVLPLTLNLAASWIAAAVPWTSVTLDQDFRWNLAAREKVVGMVRSGELHSDRPDEPDLIHLPFWYGHVSEDGVIMLERRGDATAIFFFTFRGILDNFSGFIYRSDDNPPFNSDFGGDFKEMKKLRSHWFWAAST
jgi:hypothetical protein